MKIYGTLKVCLTTINRLMFTVCPKHQPVKGESSIVCSLRGRDFNCAPFHARNVKRVLKMLQSVNNRMFKFLHTSTLFQQRKLDTLCVSARVNKNYIRRDDRMGVVWWFRQEKWPVNSVNVWKWRRNFSRVFNFVWSSFHSLIHYYTVGKWKIY